MNRITAILLAALEAFIAAAVGVGIALVPLTVLWATHYDLVIDWSVFWRASADIWLLGNGVDLMVTLDPALAAALGLPGAAAPFAVTIAPLGFALLAALLGWRAGARAAGTPHRLVAACVSIGLYGLIAVLVTLSAAGPVVTPAAWQGFVLPVIVYGLGVAVGARRGRRVREQPAAPEQAGGALDSAQQAWQGVPHAVRAVLRAGITGGGMAAAAVVAVASVLVAVMVFANYATIIRLYEGIQADLAGGATLTLAQLALVPNLVIWAAAWLTGPGFAIGTGSAVTPLGAQLGPIPALPVLGALPGGELAFGFVGLLAPVLVGFLAGAMVRPIVARAFANLPEPRVLLAAGAAVGIAGGAMLGMLAWISGGAAGPGRLIDVGPNPWLVFCFASLEIGAAAIIGILVRRTPVTQPAAPPARWHETLRTAGDP